ncbi:hypothetical protein FQA39_LY05204 [Lamprigera yunnana]|nr:hypothetical protein FQA39_LY05204 [Lamprigera yunnana]
MSCQIREITIYNETDGSSPYVEVGEDKTILPTKYKQYHEIINKFEVRDSDIYLLGHPKSGTTWAQEMIWLIINNLNYKGAEEALPKRCPHLETPIYIENDEQIYGEDFMTHLNMMPSPRCIRTHLPWQLLPEQIKNGSKKPKIIHVFRVPEDVCVSYYHQLVFLRGYAGGLDEMCSSFLAGRTLGGPFWKSVLSIWQQRHNNDILIIMYANMKKNLAGTIKDVAKFLQRNVNDDDMEKLLHHLSLESMKANTSVNLSRYMEDKQLGFNVNRKGEFIRKGVSEGYKSEMTEEQIEAFKKWTQENLVGVDLESITNI